MKQIWLHKAPLSACFMLCLWSVTQLHAQSELDVLYRWQSYTDAPNALIHYVSDEALHYLKQRKKEVEKIQTKDQWKARQQWAQQTLQKVIGPFPQKTALQAQITHAVQKQGFRMENLVYQSVPGYYVTAALFIPRSLKKGKAPAIIYCSGHSDDAYRTYQQPILNLVHKGFVVLAFDPISQGERVQHLKPGTHQPFFKWPAFEHSYIGAQFFMNGSTMARQFIWDGIRAVDYLHTRKEIDTSRIGITGRSGGGMQSMYIAAMDNRIKAVAPENYITSFTALIHSIGLQDAEQNFLSGIKQGLDMADLIEVKAPAPVMVIATTRDMFPIEGVWETAAEVSRTYQALGAPQNFSVVTDDASHTSTKKNREAMYAFFQKTLGMPGSSTDEVITPLSTAELKVTPTGQTVTSYKAETAFTLNKKAAARKLEELHKKGKAENLQSRIEKAKQLCGYTPPESKARRYADTGLVFMGTVIKPAYQIEKYRVETNKGYVIPYLLLRPKQPNGKAAIYLDPAGKRTGTGVHSTMDWLAKDGFTVLAPDLAGMGEMGPGVFKGDSFIDSISYNIWFTTVMCGSSIVGAHASDISLLAGILKKDPAIRHVYGFAKAQLSPALLHAAAFDSVIEAVALINPYASYRSIVMNPLYRPEFLYSTVAGSVGMYDLPDLAASLAPRKLFMAGITDGNCGREDEPGIKEDMEVIKKGFSETPQQLAIVNSSSEKMITELKVWMEK